MDDKMSASHACYGDIYQQLSRAVSFITVAHEIGHNHGSPVRRTPDSKSCPYSLFLLQHDPAGECYDGQYIMYPLATSGNNKAFSDCSKRSIGRTIESRGGCFTACETMHMGGVT